MLKNRYKALRRQYSVIKNLLGSKEFSWDDKREAVTAHYCEWQNYIKTQKDSRQYVTRQVPCYKDLCVICRDMNTDSRDSTSQNLGQQYDYSVMRTKELLENPESLATSSLEKMELLLKMLHLTIKRSDHQNVVKYFAI